MENANLRPGKQAVYIIGARSIGHYGGFETFVMNLLREHAQDPSLQYYVTFPAAPGGRAALSRLPGARRVSPLKYEWNGARCIAVRAPLPFRRPDALRTVFCTLRALQLTCRHIERHRPERPVVLILASRIGLFEKPFAERIRRAGGTVLQNPDGHEDRRRKWPLPVRIYWKLSERAGVKNADLVVCDSRAIESYIHEEYASLRPRTVFIPYGAETARENGDPRAGQPDEAAGTPAGIREDREMAEKKLGAFLAANGLVRGRYLLIVGRFVPENNYDIMFREYLRSGVDLDLCVITTENRRFADKLEKATHFRESPRIRLAGTVYDPALLGLIRENAFAYLHGHEVGGTNPSLLESLARTDLNLLLDTPFSRECAGDTAFYWTKEEGSLSALLRKAAAMDPEEIRETGRKAKDRIRKLYSWASVASAYRDIFMDPLAGDNASRENNDTETGSTRGRAGERI